MEEKYNEISPKIVETPNTGSLSPMEIIKSAANAAGIKLQDPNPNCKHCYGRGYIGVNQVNGEPIACNCILPKMNETTRKAYESRAFIPHNRRERRLYEKLVQREMTKHRKSR